MKAGLSLWPRGRIDYSEIILYRPALRLLKRFALEIISGGELGMKLFCSVTAVLLLLFLCTLARAETPTQNAEPAKEWVRIISPQEGTEVVGKKPLIKAEFTRAVTPGTLFVTLDSTDITQLLTVNDTGFEYRPFVVMQAGSHTLNITVSGKDGNRLEKTVSFSTRHTESAQEAYTDNDLSMVYESTLKKPEKATTTPYSKIEGNLRSDTKIRNNELQFTFNTNLRYLDQSLPVLSPLKKGIDAANWLLTGSFSRGSTNIKASFGDVQVNETAYTVMSLARKGGVLNLDFGNYFLNAFSVKSAQIIGFRGIGVSDDTDDHILGVSGGLRLIDRKVELRTIYANGGEDGNSVGISTASGKKEGDVLGFLFTSNFFQNKLMTEFETDLSGFDPDTKDEFGRKKDRAYKIKVGGNIDRYNYEAMYERVGKDYEVVGNPGVQKDREGVTLRGGGGLGVHNINLMFSRYHDNVRGDVLFPRIVNTQGSIDYSFSGIPTLPLGLNYQKSIQENSRETTGSTPVNLHTDIITGRVNYMGGAFGLGGQTAYSLMNDQTATNNDTRTITYTITPTYNVTGFSASSNFMLNRSKNSLTNYWTDTYTINADLRTKFLKDRGSFDVAATYNITKADNGSVDGKNLNASFRLGYMIKEILRGFVKPTVAIRGTYLRNKDRVNPSADKDEFTLFLVLATSTPFSF